MRQDDERELVLGNKQLLSLFFVAAALCGVCFAIGYMVGRNTSKASISAPDQAAGGTAEGRRTQPDTPTESQLPPAEPTVTAPTETKPAIDSQPAQTSPVPETKSAEAKPTEARQVPPEPKAYEAPRSKPASDDPLAVATPEAGASYLQVAALPRPDAEGMVKTLREQKFPVIMALSSKQGFYRVLVGPYRQTVALSDAKSKLKNLGFNGAFVQKQ